MFYAWQTNTNKSQDRDQTRTDKPDSGRKDCDRHITRLTNAISHDMVLGTSTAMIYDLKTRRHTGQERNRTARWRELTDKS